MQEQQQKVNTKDWLFIVNQRKFYHFRNFDVFALLFAAADLNDAEFDPIVFLCICSKSDGFLSLIKLEISSSLLCKKSIFALRILYR